MANESVSNNQVSDNVASEQGGDVNITVVDGVCVMQTADPMEALASSAMAISKPAAGETLHIGVVEGQKYFFDFNENNVQSFVQDGENLSLLFDDGSSIVFNGFVLASQGALPTTLSFGNTLSADQLEGLINVVDTTPDEDVLEEPQAELREEAVDVTNVEPAAGDNAAQVASVEPAAGEEVASVEPAAGDDAGDTENQGAQFENFQSTAVGPLGAVGPIDPTQLQYVVEFQSADLFDIDQDSDAGPSANGFVSSIDESDLGPLPVEGTVDVDFGADGPGAIAPNGEFDVSGSLLGGNLTSGGQEITVTETPTGYVGTIDGGATTVFTLTIDELTGEYIFTQIGPLDHADSTDPDDVITLIFGVDASDSDGDTVTTNIVINIADDAPLVADPDSNTFDESLLTGGPVVINDALVVDFGNDVAGTVTPGGASSVTGVAELTSGGEVITITPTANGYIGTLPGGATAFELVIDPATGAYTFTQNVPLDHNSANDTISLKFDVDVTDFDGDSTQTSITVNITDSTPVFNDKPVLGDGLQVVDETDLPGVSVDGQLSVDFGVDAPGTVAGDGTFMSGGSQLDGTLTSGGQPVTVELVGDTYVGTVPSGEKIFELTVNPDGSYEFDLLGTLDHADPNDPNDIIDLMFGVSVTDGDGDTDSTTIVIKVKDDAPTIGDISGDVDETALDNGPISTSDTLVTNFGTEVGSILPDGGVSAQAGGNTITLTSGGQTVVLTATANGYVGTVDDGATTVFEITIDSTTGAYTYTQFEPFDHPDGMDPNDTIELLFDVAVVSTDGDSDSATITISVADDGPVANDDVSGSEEGQTITGDLLANDDLSSDAANTISQVEIGGEIFTIPNGGSEDFVTSLGTLTLNSDGTYKFVTVDGTDPDGTFELTYTLVDSDGDSDTATLTIRVTPDGQPIAITGSMTVDETNLTPGPLVINETLNVDFGLDGAGTITPSGLASAGGSVAGTQLTSGGQVVEIQATANGYVGVIQGTTTQVFELIVQNDGQYSFELFQTLDHADSTDPNDLISLEFGVTIADADGDSAAGTITINVLDDAPVALDDTNSVAQNTTTVSGNVVDNDTQGEDAPSSVTNVRFNGTDVAVVEGTPTVINGDHGVLTINSDGTYSYVSNGTNTTAVQDVFTYTLTDADGDSDTAELTIDVLDSDDNPKLSDPAALTVDETDLDPTDTDSNTVSADFGNDGPGTYTVTGAGTFDFSGAANDQLTSNGTPVSVGVEGNDYVGRANGEEVFRLKLNNTTGEYEFILTGVLDHADTTDPDDIIELNFGVTVTDSDGDSDTGTIVVNVKDDGPSIDDKKGSVDEDGLANGGDSITLTDTLDHSYGEDGSGEIRPTDTFMASFEAGGQAQTLTSDGDVITVTATSTGYVGTINGGTETVFELTVQNNGEYTYTQFLPVDHPDATNPDDVISLKFEVEIVDYDGDTDTADIVVDIRDGGPVANDDCVQFNAADGALDGNVVDNDSEGPDVAATVTQVKFGDQTFDVPTDGTDIVINGQFGALTIDSSGSYTYELFDNVFAGTTGATASLNPVEADTNGSQDSLTKDGITVSVTNPGNFDISWVDTPDGSGLGIDNLDTNDSTKVWPSGEGFDIGFAENASKVTITIAELGDNNDNGDKGADLKITLADGRVIDVEVQFDPAQINNGQFEFTLDSADYGELITSVVIASTNEGIYKAASMLLNNVEVEYPGDSVESVEDEFEYVLTDQDGDTDTAELKVKALAPEDTVIVGDNIDDVLHGDSCDDTIFGQEGNDVIKGGEGSDTLYGGSGADVFLYEALSDGVDTVKDFDIAEGDVLDVSALLNGFDALQDSINDFVFATESNGNTTIFVDESGSGDIANATQIAVLESVTGLDLEQATNNGQTSV